MHDFFDLIKALAWPLVIAGALLGFRKSLSNFLKEVAGRATKLSITSIFAIELPLPEASHPQSDQFRLDLQKLAAGEEYISIVSILLDQVKKEKALDYMIADLGSGQRWLTSRLFIFAAILQRVRSLRCVVFLETRDGIKDRFLGITLPHEILLAFARQYSWLDEAYVKAYIQVDPNNVLLSTKPMYGVVDSNEASYFTLRFIASIQNPEAPVPD
ncbi:MAG TPA: hypothetical protein VEL31_05590, partial [Ktedonobacteraceae bacterium]|nr:hypothetical protein [Ktedonobacteraceae bacterium]